MTANAKNHPCFNEESKGKYGRIHLPVAPKCNIQCNYCNRNYDCVNESRPGVTSSVLTPKQALKYLTEIKKQMPNLKVAGIAGPGDPFANPEETLETLRLIKENFDDMVLCVSTNGLNVAPYIDQLVAVGLTHLTITINSIDPSVGRFVYGWVRDGGKSETGARAAEILMNKQLEAVKLAKKAGLIVKVNCIVIPGVNDNHVVEVAKHVSELGADLFNCIKLMPVKGTLFEDLPSPGLRYNRADTCRGGKYIEQMRHCARCRSDAVGLLGEKLSASTADMLKSFANEVDEEDKAPYVAVATMEGLLVNMHLGQVKKMAIYEQVGEDIRFVGNRITPPSGCGDKRWNDFADKFIDCRTILASQAGPRPIEILKEKGIEVICMEGLLDQAVKDVYDGKEIRQSVRTLSKSCQGAGDGCNT